MNGHHHVVQSWEHIRIVQCCPHAQSKRNVFELRINNLKLLNCQIEVNLLAFVVENFNKKNHTFNFQ